LEKWAVIIKTAQMNNIPSLPTKQWK